MKMQFKKKGDGISFARKESYEFDKVQYEADLKDGDIIKILDSGTIEIGQFGEQKNFKVKTRNGTKKLSLNQMSENVLVKELGEDSENWVDKDVKVILKKDLIAGKKVIIVYLVIGNWKLDEYGELVKEGENEPPIHDEPEYPF